MARIKKIMKLDEDVKVHSGILPGIYDPGKGFMILFLDVLPTIPWEFINLLIIVIFKVFFSGIPWPYVLKLSWENRNIWGFDEGFCSFVFL